MSLHKHIFDIWVPKQHMSLGTHKFEFQKAKTAHTQACTNIYFARTYLRRCSLPLIVVCRAGGNGDSGTHASAGGVRETSRRRFLFYPIQQLSDWDIAGIICQLPRQPCSSCCIALPIPLLHPRDRQLSLHNGVQRPLFLLLLPTRLPLLLVHCCDDRRLHTSANNKWSIINNSKLIRHRVYVIFRKVDFFSSCYATTSRSSTSSSTTEN